MKQVNQFHHRLNIKCLVIRGEILNKSASSLFQSALYFYLKLILLTLVLCKVQVTSFTLSNSIANDSSSLNVEGSVNNTSLGGWTKLGVDKFEQQGERRRKAAEDAIATSDASESGLLQFHSSKSPVVTRDSKLYQTAPYASSITNSILSLASGSSTFITSSSSSSSGSSGISAIITGVSGGPSGATSGGGSTGTSLSNERRTIGNLPVALVSANNLIAPMTTNGNRDPPCSFNPLCSCSKPHPDLGVVTCIMVPLTSVPAILNTTTLHKAIFIQNSLRRIEPASFYGTGLSSLEITHNQLSWLPFQSLFGLERTLRELNLHHNKLTSIPRAALSQLTRLRELNLGYNLISEIKGDFDFPSNLRTSLRTLVLTGNSLTYLEAYSFRSLDSLQYLDISGNNLFALHDLSLSQPVTSGSSISTSHLTSAPVTIGLSSLDTLILADNRLTRIPFNAIGNLSTLRNLDLSHNLISNTADSLDYKGRKLSLNHLRLDFNRIDCLVEDALENFAEITRVHLSHNPIRTIEDFAFRSTRIHQLHLMSLPLLQSVSPWALSGLEKSLTTLKLELPSHLILSNDSLGQLESLIELSIAGSPVSPLALLASQYTLQDLTVDHSFDPAQFELHFPSVRKLNLAHVSSNGVLNRSHLLAFGDLGLEQLDLSSSGLSEISESAFEATPSLRFIDLSNNSINTIAPGSFKFLSRSLQTLDMSNAFAQRPSSSSSSSSSSTIQEQLCHFVLPFVPSLLHLNLSRNNLAILSEDCFSKNVHLLTLNLDFNQLHSLSPNLISHSLTSLVSFSASFNKISKILPHTFAELDDLVSIDLSYNQINEIYNQSFANLHSVVEINVKCNDIASLSPEAFFYLPRIQLVDLSFNRLTSVHLSSFDQLGTLSTLHIDLSNNLLTTSSSNHHGTLIISSLVTSSSPQQHQQQHQASVPISIEIINLSKNKLVAIPPLESLKNSLAQLILSHNSISNLSNGLLTNLKSLQVLDLSYNSLEYLTTDTFNGDFSLQVLDVSNNDLLDISSDIFTDSGNLRVVKLSHNKLPFLPDSLFRVQRNLEVLSVSWNKLTFFPSSSLSSAKSSLRIVDLSHNEIRSLTTSVTMSNDGNVHHYVHSSGNLVGYNHHTGGVGGGSGYVHPGNLGGGPSHMTLPGGGPGASFGASSYMTSPFTRLVYLDLSHNKIRYIPDDFFCPSCFPSLEQLNLSFNQLRVISDTLFDGTSSTLKSLSLSGNSLRSLPMLSIPGLQVLNISWNQITAPNSISLTNITELRELNMSGNRLTSVPSNLWINANKLRILDISCNPIITIGEASFLGLDQLEVLSMYNLTRVSSIAPKSLYPLFNLQSLTVSTNSKLSTFSISTLVEEITGLRELIVIPDPNEDEFRANLLQTGSLPRKLNHIRIKGSISVPSNSENWSIQQSPLLSSSSDTGSNLHSSIEYGATATGFGMNEASQVNAIGGGGEESLISQSEFAASSVDSHLEEVRGGVMRIQEDSFSRIQSDQIELSITGTQISSLSPSILTTLGVHKLSLDVRNNALTSLPDLSSLGERLQELRLSGNPWTCDCSLIWLLEWIQSLKATSVKGALEEMLTVHCTDLSSTSTSNSLGDDESSTGYRQPIRLVDQLRTHLRDCSNEATATSTTVTFASTALMSTMSILAIWLSSSC